MPYLDANSPALFLSTRLGRQARGLGAGVAFQAPVILNKSMLAPSSKPSPTSTGTFRPIAIPIPGLPRITIPAFTTPTKTTTPTIPAIGPGSPGSPGNPAPPPPPPQGGTPQGLIPNGPSNVPAGLQPVMGAGPAPNISTSTGAPVYTGPVAGDGSSGGPGVSLFASLPWYAWVALGLAGFYVARKVLT